MTRYRLNSAAMIVNEEGRLLVCERSDKPGCFQFPQGGVDDDETSLEALMREVQEEVGYSADCYVVERSQSGYRYDYPVHMLGQVRLKRGRSYIGQEQTYFLCRLRRGAHAPLLDQREFAAYRWIDPSSFDLAWLPDFKKDVYQRVMKDFFGVDLPC